MLGQRHVRRRAWVRGRGAGAVLMAVAVALLALAQTTNVAWADATSSRPPRWISSGRGCRRT